MKTYYLSFICFTLCLNNSKAQFFTKIITGPLVSTAGDSRSVNWVDVNNDGLVDCFISNGPSGGQNNRLYINNGSGGFSLTLNDPIVTDSKPSDGATFADSDNDGDLDCFVVNWYNVNNLFYLNTGSGAFSQVTTGIQSNDAGYSETASWGDYDKDGLVDLYVTNSAGSKKNFLYRNTATSTFTKISTGAIVNDVFDSTHSLQKDPDRYIRSQGTLATNLCKQPCDRLCSQNQDCP